MSGERDLLREVWPFSWSFHQRNDSIIFNFSTKDKRAYDYAMPFGTLNIFEQKWH